jgi:hypothetical protein
MNRERAGAGLQFLGMTSVPLCGSCLDPQCARAYQPPFRDGMIPAAATAVAITVAGTHPKLPGSDPVSERCRYWLPPAAPRPAPASPVERTSARSAADRSPLGVDRRANSDGIHLESSSCRRDFDHLFDLAKLHTNVGSNGLRRRNHGRLEAWVFGLDRVCPVHDVGYE